VPLPKLLADVNVAVEVVAWLRHCGVDVSSILERSLAHLDDEEILALARSEERFVLTHDSDFGRMIFAEGRPFYRHLLASGRRSAGRGDPGTAGARGR
jgi:predicted nuclease of predicted toxin-antitoxin system